ncbi:nucleotide-diphospho-sugar transferase [Pedobacter sp. G11]|uniref:nucleotide-diphospho-sugar transferase n=1 Tax=Pedobacter sp. G11 TaxID=2482728 RepID=UPI000F5FA18E|nr:nucleotide-diphospho-sugar transferase [Pedobacter sp. G11]AZI25850.1 nucleotide-diphospho-sugar transferase [Pedobacter sp. G11]
MEIPPILFLVFNRPTHTRKVFETIRVQKPKHLFIASDGARNGNENDEINVSLVREIVKDIDWDCEVNTLFRDKNLGCKTAVSEAITWFFNHIDEGIILEDDCLPDPSFFNFCGSLLDKYRFNDKVMAISGSNLLTKREGYNSSYVFGLGGIWGWATWKRAWNLYDLSMAGWNDPKIKNRVKAQLKSNWYKHYYHMFDAAFNQSLNTWDIQWFYAILYNEKLAINPAVNLVQNIGFDANGTHSHGKELFALTEKKEAINFPLIHPDKLKIDYQYLDLLYSETSSGEKRNIFKSVLKKVYRASITLTKKK